MGGDNRGDNRGDNNGGKGKGFSGTYIKDTWKKTKGIGSRWEVGMGENGDNCT